MKAMIIIAWNGGTPSDIFDRGVFKQVLSIFITAAILKLCQGMPPSPLSLGALSYHDKDCWVHAVGAVTDQDCSCMSSYIEVALVLHEFYWIAAVLQTA